jgi:hypothetical protein
MKMNSWQTKLSGDSLFWLLELDEANPGVRYFALRDQPGRALLCSARPPKSTRN